MLWQGFLSSSQDYLPADGNQNPICSSNALNYLPPISLWKSKLNHEIHTVTTNPLSALTVEGTPEPGIKIS